MSKEKFVQVKVGTLTLSTQEFKLAYDQISHRVIHEEGNSVDRAILQILMEHMDHYDSAKKENLKNLPLYMGRQLPQPGDIIYVPTRWSIDHGENDVVGGKAKVKAIKIDNYGNQWVETWEHPNRSYNWDVLLNNQEKWSKEYSDRWAYPDPDCG